MTEKMTREQLNYYTAVAKGMTEYDNAQNIAVKVDPAKAPTKAEAFSTIEEVAKSGNSAAMMRMGDLTRKDRDELPKADPAIAAEWLTKAHKSLEEILNDRDESKAHQKADANWDMSAVHYYNSTLPEGTRADLKFPEGIKTPEEADLYYTTLAARAGTNHRYSEWVERVNEGLEYKMDAGRKQEIMDLANSQDLPTIRIYGSGKENLGEAHNYPPYVSTAKSRAELLEAIRDGKTNPADPVDEKFDDKMKDKLEKLEKIDPKTKMSDLDAATATMEKSETSQISQSAASLAVLNSKAVGASMA